MSTILDFITPDVDNPDIGKIKLTHDQLLSAGIQEGFVPGDIDSTIKVTDEIKLVSRIIYNRSSSILLRRVYKDRAEDQEILYLHPDGAISVKNNDKNMICHCFDNLKDIFDYYSKNYLVVNYPDTPNRIKFEIKTTKELYENSKKEKISSRVKRSVIERLKTYTVNKDELANEIRYVDNLDKVDNTLILFGNSDNSGINMLYIAFCKDCIWAIYPSDDNYSTFKVINQSELHNRVFEFIESFSN